MENNVESLTLESAVDILRSGGDSQDSQVAAEADDNGAQHADGPPDDGGHDENYDDNASEIVESGDDADAEAPATEPAAADADDDEADPAELPPIAPPSSWPKADWEMFSKLPRDTQERIAALEQKRTSEHRSRQNELAAREKAIAEQAAALEQEMSAYYANMAEHLPEPPDEALIDEDPVEYMRQDARYKRAINEMNAALARQREKEIKEQAEKAAQMEKWQKQEAERLVGLIPELKDSSKGQKIASAIAAYGERSGYNKEALAMASADDIHILYKAMKWDQAQDAARAAKARPIPKVAAPGNAQSASGRLADRRASALSKLEKTGSLDDAVAAYRLLKG